MSAIVHGSARCVVTSKQQDVALRRLKPQVPSRLCAQLKNLQLAPSRGQAGSKAHSRRAMVVRYVLDRRKLSATCRKCSFQVDLPCWFCRSAAATETALQTPHGNKLVDLMLPEDKKQSAIDSCTETLECSDRNACDIELLIVG